MNKLGIFLALVLFIGTFVLAGPAAVAAKNSKQMIVKGTLLSEKCMTNGKTSACYLEWYDGNSLVLLTGTRQLYKLNYNQVAKWKLNNGFGKQVAIKGVLDGKEIIVKDLVALGGKKKLSKACL